jgi:hypothetical protein
VIDTDALLELLWVAFVAGITLVVATSLTIFGAARAGHERRRRNTRAATLYTGLAVAGTLACGLGVVLGVAIMLDK